MIHLAVTSLILKHFAFYDTTKYGKQADENKHIAQEENGSSTVLRHLRFQQQSAIWQASPILGLHRNQISEHALS